LASQYAPVSSFASSLYNRAVLILKDASMQAWTPPIATQESMRPNAPFV
jgi:hypothetical protein